MPAACLRDRVSVHVSLHAHVPVPVPVSVHVLCVLRTAYCVLRYDKHSLHNTLHTMRIT